MISQSRRSHFFLLVFVVLHCVIISNEMSYEDDLTLTLEQKALLDRFKSVMVPLVPTEYMKEESFMVRWLRSRLWNLPEAERMLLEHITWWKENRMDIIHDEDWSEFAESKFWTEGRDKEGRPILYIHVGSWDLRRQVITGKQDRFLRYVSKGMDEVYGIVRELGEKYRNVSQGVLLLNVDGFSLVKHGCLQCVPLFLRILFLYETHYPGLADKIIAINVPVAAEFMVTAARGALHPDTNRVLYVYGVNPRIWRPVLDRYFEWNQLPKEVGGTKIYGGLDLDY